LQRQEVAVQAADANKASVNFKTDHSRGSLAKVLTKIADGNINLSKLQSFPIAGTNFKYSFHADMEFSTMEQFNGVIDAIKPLTEEVKIYGVYRNGNETND
jgi:prephenate dehydratase